VRSAARKGPDERQGRERERDVMTYLVMGRAIEDIATILEITPRTVKYHQANVLKKVGADSRLDLIRLVF
jgi:DNA-binding NarL/FixJ family response regulator